MSKSADINRQRRWNRITRGNATRLLRRLDSDTVDFATAVENSAPMFKFLSHWLKPLDASDATVENTLTVNDNQPHPADNDATTKASS